MKTTNKLIIQIGIVLGFLGTIIVNTLSSIGILNNKDPGSLSDALPNLFVPAGITFAVWGVIYIGLLALTIYSIRSWFKKDMEPPEELEKYGIEFIVAAVANITWIFLWHWQSEIGSTGYSLGAMLILLGALLSATIRLKIGRNNNATTAEKWLVHIPFSLYLGWITIATVANVTALFVETGFSSVIAPTSQWELILTVVMIAIAVIITMLNLITRNNIAYSLVVIWALTGIILKRIEVGIGSFASMEIIIATATGIAYILLMIIVSSVKLIIKRKEAKTVSF
ncbi:MAG: hypothetical protein FK731_12705 [Asgard group archaeon]|nr:hypothetical protein [Asgard group archaeon]